MTTVLRIPIVFEDSKKINFNFTDPKQNITQQDIDNWGLYTITNNKLIVKNTNIEATSWEEGFFYTTNDIPLT